MTTTVTDHRTATSPEQALLDPLPADWTLERVSNRANIAIGWTPPTEDDSNFDGDNLWANISDLGPRFVRDTAKRVSDAAVRVRRARPAPAGSLLFSFKLSVGAVSFAAVPIYTNEAIAAFTPRREIDMGYAYYAFPIYILRNAGENIYGAPILNQTRLAQAKVAFPPLAQQRAIADYLDRETAQIDAFIAKNEELIALLTERRTAVTAKAVTRGIDDIAVLEDSGKGWLGSVPKEWEVVRLKFVVQSLPGFAFASGDFVDDDNATRLLRGVNVGVGVISWSETVGIANAQAEVARRYKLVEGDLVLGMDRPVIAGGLRVALIGEADADALLVQRVLRLRGKRVRNDYLEYSLAWGGFAMYIEPDFTGVSVPHMSEQQVGNFAIALPDLEMQERIVAHIRDQHSVIDKAIDAAQRSVDLMRERRAALISAAVTGKIDVGVTA